MTNEEKKLFIKSKIIYCENELVRLNKIKKEFLQKNIAVGEINFLITITKHWLKIWQKKFMEFFS